ncbi:MAG: hypothetical protein H6839_18120 [Planctomycetes bacterium]|nr:hypothetical protein [Planctomycetota bacterium]
MSTSPYITDGTEHLSAAEGIPQPLRGAPELTVIQTPVHTIVAYYVDDGDRQPAPEVELIADTGHKHHFAIVKLKTYATHLAVRGERDDHPLTKSMGEAIAEVRPSPWIRELGPPSGWSKFKKSDMHWRHLLFALHDERFEAVCQVVGVSVHPGPMKLSKLIEP